MLTIFWLSNFARTFCTTVRCNHKDLSHSAKEKLCLGKKVVSKKGKEM